MRETRHLRRRYLTILSHLGLISALTGVTMLLPVLATLGWEVEGRAAAAFLLPGIALILGGTALWRHLGRNGAVLTLSEGGVVVVASWLVACASGMVPFLVIEHLSVTQAAFESVSGWTTTGLSVLDVTRCHPAVLLWRSVMQLAGGAGLAILMLSSFAAPGGSSLSFAEGRSDQLAPNVRTSAVLVMRMYTGYAVAGVLMLRLVGMSWWDAVNHAFCAISTGGFSTRTESIGAWDSPAVEAVILVLMIVGNLNFLTAWALLRGRLAAVGRNGEIRVMATLVPIGTALLLAFVTVPTYGWAPKAVRVALFETVSALTTTGFSTVGYAGWGGLPVLVLIVLMLVGSGACSTGGALKQQRVHLLFRSLVRELRLPFLPRAVVRDETTWVGDRRQPIDDAQLRSVATFAFLYVATWLVGSGVLAATGVGLQNALFEFASALGTVGLSVGVTGPDAPGLLLWTETVGMLLGRLEFLVLFMGLVKLVRDARCMLRASPRLAAARQPRGQTT